MHPQAHAIRILADHDGVVVVAVTAHLAALRAGYRLGQRFAFEIVGGHSFFAATARSSVFHCRASGAQFVHGLEGLDALPHGRNCCTALSTINRPRAAP